MSEQTIKPPPFPKINGSSNINKPPPLNRIQEMHPLTSTLDRSDIIEAIASGLRYETKEFVLDTLLSSEHAVRQIAKSVNLTQEERCHVIKEYRKKLSVKKTSESKQKKEHIKKNIKFDMPEEVKPLDPKTFSKKWLEVLNDIDENLRAWKYFKRKKERASIQPRFNQLIMAPSGSGKTHALKAYARSIGARYFRLTFSSHIPVGAKEPSTLGMLKNYYSNNSSPVIIHLDELEKMDIIAQANTTSWSMSIRDEWFQLLDFTIPTITAEDETWSDEQIDNFKNNTFIVGTPTFQDIFNKKKVSGFNGYQENQIDLNSLRETVSDELLFRFSSDIHIVNNLSVDEYESIAYDCGLLEKLDELDIDYNFEDAVQQNLNYRYLECLVTKAIKKEALLKNTTGFWKE